MWPAPSYCRSPDAPSFLVLPRGHRSQVMELSEISTASSRSAAASAAFSASCRCLPLSLTGSGACVWRQQCHQLNLKVFSWLLCQPAVMLLRHPSRWCVLFARQPSQ